MIKHYLRYLANRYRLVGHTAIHKAEADEVIDAISDIQSKFFAVFSAEDKKGIIFNKI